MPLKTFQRNYWNLSDTAVAPVSPPSQGGYPMWQSSIVASLFGALWELAGMWWRQWRAQPARPATTRLGKLYAFWRQVRALPLAQVVVLERAVSLITDPRFALAQQAVVGTATTHGFQRSESWLSLSHLLKADRGRAENMYRHVRALETTRDLVRAQGSTLTNPQLNLLVELAYHTYTVTGRV